MSSRHWLFGSALALATLSVVTPAPAAVLVEYEFTGDSLAPTTTEPGVGATSLSTVSTTSNGFNSDPDVAGTPSGAPAYVAAGFADDSWFAFTITNNSANLMSVSGFEYWQKTGSTGSRIYDLRYLVNGGLVQTAVNDANISTTTYTQRTANLSGRSDLQNLAPGTTVEFRIAGFFSASDTTTFRIDDVQVQGTIPEPAGLTLVGVAATGLLARRRRR